MSRSERVVWISPRTIVALVLLVAVAVGGWVYFQSTNPDASVLAPAKHVARGLATMDAYVHPDAYKSDLTWISYQQLLAAAPPYQAQNAREPFDATIVKDGTALVLDRGVFEGGVDALVQTFVKNKAGVVSLIEFQLQMIPDGNTWKVNAVMNTLVKGEVKGAAAK